MVRFYYTDIDYLSIDAQSSTIEEENYNQIMHIPYSNKFITNRLGFTKSINISIDFASETDFNNFVSKLDSIVKISFDGIKYFDAFYNGGNSKKLLWAGIYTPNVFTFLLSGLAYSLVEYSKNGGVNLPNSGNYPATPKFTITGTHNLIKISDGTRELQFQYSTSDGDTIEIENWKAFVNGEEKTQYLSGDFPLIPVGSTFQFILTGLNNNEITIKYRDTWRW